jgi:hypothetical protein
VVHELPNRVRVRLDARCCDISTASLMAALRASALVVSFRLARDCNSITVTHVATPHAILRLIKAGLERRTVVWDERVAAVASVRENERRRLEERRLVLCSAVGLALAVLPTPVKPGLLALRLALSITVAIVQRRAERFASAPLAARAMDMLTSLVSLWRAEHWLRELLISLLHKRVEDQLWPRVQCGFGSAPLRLGTY